jgi:glycosyltransferase involved in cell wall biosynthesis
MGTYNRAHLLRTTLESIEKQTFSDWELIIADDGSHDETPKIVEELKKDEPRILYIRSDVNQGISRNYNMGLEAARGEFVAMIDDDDPWLDQKKLEKQIAFLDEHADFVGCGGGVVVVNGEGKELYRYLKPENDSEIRRYMLYSNPMANSTTLFRLEAAKRVGLYDASIRYAGDRDFWLKMGRIGKLYNFPEYFSYYTMTGQNTSITKIKPHLETALMVMKRYKKDYPNYYPALLVNELQYAYAFLPEGFRRVIHRFMARLKRTLVK